MKNRILFVAGLNLFFAIVELLGGLITNSLSIISDALHDFGDAIALLASYWMHKKSEQAGDPNFSYGYQRWSLLSVFLLGFFLVGGAGFIFWEAIERLQNPVETKPLAMIGFAILGLFINGFSLLKIKNSPVLHTHSHGLSQGVSHDVSHGLGSGHDLGQSLQERILSLHFIEDLLGWAIVLVGAIVIYFFRFHWLDPLLAIILSIWVIYNAVQNLRQSFRIFLQGLPEGVTLNAVQSAILKVPGILQVHHLHIWSLDGNSHILTAHLVVSPSTQMNQTSAIKNNVKKTLHHEFRIAEATLEIESEKEGCWDPHH